MGGPRGERRPKTKIEKRGRQHAAGKKTAVRSRKGAFTLLEKLKAQIVQAERGKRRMAELGEEKRKWERPEDRYRRRCGKRGAAP